MGGAGGAAVNAPERARERSGPVWFVVETRWAERGLGGLLGAWLAVTATVLVLSWFLFGRW